MKTGETRWPFWKLALLLAPFATSAVAINLFLFGLLFPHAGLAVLSPLQAVVWSIPLGIPASILAARWVQGLINAAEHDTPPPRN